MNIKQSVKNTFDRIKLDFESYEGTEGMSVTVSNWITGDSVETSPLIKRCVEWVYKTQIDFENGNMGCRQDDFDRVRYFILEVDPKVYSTCID